MNPTTTAQHIVLLDRVQRRRLLARAIGWIGLGGIPIAVCCTYGPLAINWLIPSTADLLVAVVDGIVIALADIALVYVLLFGLALFQEGLAGVAVQTADIVHAPARSILATPFTVRGERAGVLCAATPKLVSTVRTGQLHAITYSPRARMLWACSAIDQTEASRA